MRSMRIFSAVAVAVLTASSLVTFAQDRAASPRGQASTQIGGAWIDVEYGRPILRGRAEIFGSGDTYGDEFLLGAPLWRVGADQTTRFKTEVDLMFGDERLAAGEYGVFAELTETEWTLIFSTWGAKQSFSEENDDALWGAYGYTPDRDVLRTAMEVETTPYSLDQLTIGFTDVSDAGGSLFVSWANQVGATPFTVAP